MLFYVFALPVILAKGLFKAYYAKLGAPRYYVSVLLFLMMMSLPMKMLARWLFNLKYIVAIRRVSSSTSKSWLKRRASGTPTTSIF